jgi:amino acid adenylation domain-containing protein
MTTNVENTLHGRFLHGMNLSPDKVAIRDGDRSVTYQEVNELCLTWAGSLLRACADTPKAIGVLADKGADAYLGILTALFCGVPVVPLQPDFPVDRIRQTLKAANVSALVTDERGYRLLPDVLDPGEMKALPVLRTGSGITSGLPAEARFALSEPRTASPSDAAYILFTSGSTGRPKGVVVTHGNLSHYFRTLDALYEFTPDDVFAQLVDPTFDIAFFDMFGAWGCGGRLVNVPARAYLAMPQFLSAEGITIWYSTPAAISVLARRGALGDNAFPTLRLSLFCGEALLAGDALAWQRAAPASRLENLWGLTETTVHCSAYRWSSHASPAECLNGIVPLGQVHRGHQWFLLDSEGREHPAEGEICIRGPQVTPGYLDPEDDQERFIEHNSRRWFRTGDRARLAPNGDLLFLGRTDNQVQIQGVRIELSEIDHHVLQFDGVKDVVTVTRKVDGHPEMVVFYTGTPSRPADFSRYLLRSLPQAMVPRHYRHLDEMPLTRNKKFDRQALRKLADHLNHEAVH